MSETHRLIDSEEKDLKVKEIEEEKEIIIMSSAATYCAIMTISLGCFAFNPQFSNPYN